MPSSGLSALDFSERTKGIELPEYLSTTSRNIGNRPIPNSRDVGHHHHDPLTRLADFLKLLTGNLHFKFDIAHFTFKKHLPKPGVRFKHQKSARIRASILTPNFI